MNFPSSSSSGPSTKSTLPRVLIKLGGAALGGTMKNSSATSTRRALAQLIYGFHRLGHQTVIVHGGGPAINMELERRGIRWSFVGGQRITTPEMMDAIEMTLCGLVNRGLVRELCAQGLSAFGLSGSDNKTLLCRQAAVELGQVGQIESVNADWIDKILAFNPALVPVVAPVGIGAQGEGYNINADWSAAHLAAALRVRQLIYLTDQPGILDEGSEVIKSVSGMGLQNMIESRVVSGGMLTKTKSILHALAHGVDAVLVTTAQLALEEMNAVSLSVIGAAPVVGVQSGTLCRAGGYGVRAEDNLSTGHANARSAQTSSAQTALTKPNRLNPASEENNAHL